MERNFSKKIKFQIQILSVNIENKMPSKVLMICGETCIKCKFLKPHLEKFCLDNNIPFEEKDVNMATPEEIEGATSLPVIWFDDKQIDYDEALSIISK